MKRNKAAILCLGRAYPGIIFGERKEGEVCLFYPMTEPREVLKIKSLDEVLWHPDLAILGKIRSIENETMLFFANDDGVAEIIVHAATHGYPQDEDVFAD
jgi:hypothetical protein